MILTTTPALSSTPKRIISLVPSLTELLYHLGLENETAGITKFCIHPKEWFTAKTRVGGTKTINFDTVNQLKPDLIITNKEENVKEQVEILAKDYPVWVTDVNTLQDALNMINDIGLLTGKVTEAVQLRQLITEGFSRLNGKINSLKQRLRTAYLIWQDPYMTVGGNTFISDMLLKCRLYNIFSDSNRYPETTIAELKDRNCQLLLLASEPFPFKQKHLEDLAHQLPGCKIMLVDGEMFSWYGSRLLQAPDYFAELIKRLNKG